MSKQELAEELPKPIIRKIEKQKRYSSCVENIWESMCYWYFQYISRYTWPVPLKGKKGITITNAFQKALDESNRKLN